MAGAAAVAAVLNGASPASSVMLLPALAAARQCRPAPASSSRAPCPCCTEPQPFLQVRCHLHHRPSACASTASTSRPLAGPLAADPRPRLIPTPPLRRAPKLLLPSPIPPSTSPAASVTGPGPLSRSRFLGAAVSATATASYSSATAAPTAHSNKRRRGCAVAAAAPLAAAADDGGIDDDDGGIAAASPPAPAATSNEDAPSASSSGSATTIVDPAVQLPAFHSRLPTLTNGLGQVVASASKYVRVEVYTLLPDQEPTPQDWRPPHLRPRPPPLEAAPRPPQPKPPPPAAVPRPRLLLCSIRSLLRKLRQEVVVGDVVRVGSIDWDQGRGVVSEVLPRSSRLVDPSVANVDHAMLVFALDQPPFEELQVSRFLVAAEAAGLPFSLLLNKADLVGPEVLAARLAQCRSWGYEPIVLSCERGEGVERVARELEGRISVVSGPSGAGKSSLINCLRLGRHRPDLRPKDPRTFAAANAASGELERDSNSRDPGQLLPLGDAMDLVGLPPSVVQRYSGGGGGDCAVAAGPDHDRGWSGVAAAAAADEEPTDGGGYGEEAQEETEGGGRGSAAPGGGGGGGPGGGESPDFLAVGSLSKIGRGMHTTTAVTLLRLLGGGWLADTPGFGQPTLEDIPSQHLARCFPELVALTSAAPCRFNDCLHLAEPGCSVRGAGLERYQHYTRFLGEIRARESDDVRSLQRAKAEREGATKAKSVRGGGERREARLDARLHRRPSRQGARRAGQREEE